MEIAEQNGRLRTGDKQNRKNQKQETEHVISLMCPTKHFKINRNFSKLKKN